MRGQFKEKLQSRDGLPLQEQMLVYSRNLLGNHTLTDTFLCVLFESLPEAQLARLCEVVTPAHARLEHKGEDRKPEDRNRDWGWTSTGITSRQIGSSSPSPGGKPCSSA